MRAYSGHVSPDEIALGAEDRDALEELLRLTKGSPSAASLKRALEAHDLLLRELQGRERREEQAKLAEVARETDAAVAARVGDEDQPQEEWIGITDFRRGFDYLVKKIERGSLDHAFITRHGERVCVVVSPQRWRVMKRYRGIVHDLLARTRDEGVDATAFLERLDDPTPIRDDEPLPEIEQAEQPAGAGAGAELVSSDARPDS